MAPGDPLPTPQWLTDLKQRLQDPSHTYDLGDLTNRDNALSLVVWRYTLAHFFLPLFSLLIFLLRWLKPQGWEEAVRVTEENRAEEEGRSAYGPKHLFGRLALLIALGFDWRAWQDRVGTDLFDLRGVPGSVRHILEYYVKLALSDPRKAFAAVGYWELRIPFADYLLLERLIRNTFGFTDPGEYVTSETPLEKIPPLWHVAAHLQHDEQHFLEIFQMAQRFLSDAELQAVFEETHRVWEEAWDMRSQEFASMRNG